MAAPSNGSGNLVEEFEESFQSCLNVLTKQEAGPCVEKEEVKVEVERFIDLARQMEAFFLQKRFLLSALKPELLVKEDNNELRLELARKDELLKRHYDKIAVWQNLLADLQGYAKCGGQGSTTAATGATVVGQPGISPAPPGSQAITPAGNVNPINSATVCQPMAHAPHNQMQTQQQMQHAAVAAATQAAQLQQMQQLHQQQQHQQQQHAMQVATPASQTQTLTQTPNNRALPTQNIKTNNTAIQRR